MLPGFFIEEKEECEALQQPTGIEHPSAVSVFRGSFVTLLEAARLRPETLVPRITAT